MNLPVNNDHGVSSYAGVNTYEYLNNHAGNNPRPAGLDG
jgi:hypothetical protein